MYGTVSILFVSLTLFFSCAAKDASMVLSDPPRWYAERLKQNFVNVDQLMSQGFSRLEALEIQNNAIKMSKKENIPFAKALELEINTFQRGQAGESGFKPITELAKGDFVVVFDLDETLLVQWYRSYSKGDKYRDLCSGLTDKDFTGTLESTDCVKFTPGLNKTFARIKALEGFRGLVLFTAKGHEPAHAILDEWKIDGKPIRSFVDGVFTRNYLTRGGKVFKPSKDLRIVDPSLEHVIMVDDNPSRLFQPKNVRVFPKFNGDNYLEAKYEKMDRSSLRYYERLLKVIYKEIKNSYEYAKAQGVSFVEAFHPFSEHGSYCTRMIQDTLGYSKFKAADYHRSNPQLCKDVFYGTKIK